MNEILNYYIKTFAEKSLSLKKKGILVDKPWALIDQEGEIQKLIFKRDNRLILSKNGKVKEGSWEYFPEAMALLIDRVDDKLLLKEQFIDENVIILKIDGTNNEFIALANENSLPDYNIPSYFNTIRCKELKIKEISIYNGIRVHIIDASTIDLSNNPEHLIGKEVEEIDDLYRPKKLENGHYMTYDSHLSFYIKNNYIVKVAKNLRLGSKKGMEILIEDGNEFFKEENISKVVRINGQLISDTRLIDKHNYIYTIKESKIEKLSIMVDYSLNKGITIKVEQNNLKKISSGDRIVASNPINPIPDGTYRIKGKLKRIKIKDCVIQ
ncbi:MAG TPA: hypothetical protein VMV56_02815 [Williamwhitmania sp.]|nr:hypothetical protein [Williamwhitmania sp.]